MFNYCTVSLSCKFIQMCLKNPDTPKAPHRGAIHLDEQRGAHLLVVLSLAKRFSNASARFLYTPHRTSYRDMPCDGGSRPVEGGIV